MNEIELIKKRLDRIENRNRCVQEDKAWETSSLRRALLIAFTYLAIGLYMWVIDVARPWLNAIVPSFGFLLSTLTLPYFKQWWLGWQKKVMRNKQL
ncbi:MAG: hypothetical protein A3E37_03810 [Candidatus Andersenbacteria bacterium RIFCSPHIGHO2_12_FULL_46_9]|nr:MAG: hypothetical protein A3B76_01020 [Candidatus Andersenbacteria bacterium RIFCSPHIGHO2_02_FULL_46_16]OGY38363.1 MAG: hypothetical protein A3E37_03810 [Candidatus Andersenbacteria bacterium RIFCSPHIGHO2_12_FULL_46_9]OGY38452.1 MAG: hypothetical protein A3I08_02670 [Candidatus Andersenbacteria bacterium RIFCSPLOWO2_02_FULL_46_11]